MIFIGIGFHGIYWHLAVIHIQKTPEVGYQIKEYDVKSKLW